MAKNKMRGFPFAVRSGIVKQVLADPVFNRRLDDAQSVKEQEEVFKDYCRKYGIKIGELKEGCFAREAESTLFKQSLSH